MYFCRDTYSVYPKSTPPRFSQKTPQSLLIRNRKFVNRKSNDLSGYAGVPACLKHMYRNDDDTFISTKISKNYSNMFF